MGFWACLELIITRNLRNNIGSYLSFYSRGIKPKFLGSGLKCSGPSLLRPSIHIRSSAHGFGSGGVGKMSWGVHARSTQKVLREEDRGFGFRV